MNQRFFAKVFILGLALMALELLSNGAEIKDLESATHDTSASKYEIVKTYEFPGVKIVQIYLAVLSHYSYMIISDKDALVVDPGRDIQIYLDTAKKEGVNIKGVFLTHSHADFVAGHMELASKLGCPIYQSKDSGGKYKFVPLSDGREIKLGSIKIRFMTTPGHTPDGVCALIYSKDNTEIPKAVLTGDTLFVGSIGRPDLMGKDMPAALLAEMSYDSWNNKLSKLDDSVIVLPAHGAGSLCGAHLRDEPFSTIGTERKTNPYIQNKGKNEFVTAILNELPKAPQYFKHNAELNKQGPPLVNWNSTLTTVPNIDTSLTDVNKFYVIDLRNGKDYAGGHIPNSVNIGLRGRFETWVGTMVPWKSNLVLCGSKEQIKEAQHRLSRVGYSAIGSISVDDWKNAKLPLTVNERISSKELYQSMQNRTAPIVVDVRQPKEWTKRRIGHVLNMPLDELNNLALKLNPNEAIATVCNSAYRSSMAIGILERLGFKNVLSLDGGTEAWTEAKLPVISDVYSRSKSKKHIRLPDIIAPQTLKQIMMDMPNSFELIDIRPLQHFKEYNIPGSININIGNIIDNPTIINGKVPLIIVDRNGTLAMIIAGVLSQKTTRPIKVLRGGVASYWNLIEMKQPIKAVPMPTSKPAFLPSQQKSHEVQKPKPPKRKSAGC